MSKSDRARRVLRILIGGKLGAAILPIAIIAFVILFHVPAALAFPHHARIGETSIYAESPIDPNIYKVVDRADRLLMASPINIPGVKRQIVLTNGGWRWTTLSFGVGRVVAFRRPFSNVLVFNKNSVADDIVTNGAKLGGTRTLSGTIAHETVHMLVAYHLGEIRAIQLPAWKSEGYADYIAGETGIDPRDEGRIRASDPHARVLTYYDGRRRVAAELRKNGNSVDALMAP